MKTLSLLLVAILITACSAAAQPANDTQMEGGAARIIIASGDSIPGHSQFVTLGKVRARCMQDPEAGNITAADVIADGNLQRSAYRTYGSQVDAIIETNMFYVTGKKRLPLFDHEGHLECEGTAIHFQAEPAGGTAARSH
jgi:hypothetical protein